MQDNNKIISKLRLERAEELIGEAEELLKNERYKSANNRAYYAIEKSINALLICDGIVTLTHNGALKQFNMNYVHNSDGYFTNDDYRIASEAEHIRSASDYDDFYIASKEETVEQIKNSKYLYEKIKKKVAMRMVNE